MSEEQQTAAMRPPWHFWVIGIVALLWNAMGAFDYLMTQTQNESYMSQFTPEQLEYFYGFPAWVVSSWAFAVWGGLLGVVLLLLRKALAVPVLIFSLAAMIVTTIYSFVLSNGMEVMEGFGVFFTALIFFVSVALVFYARAMRARGLLR
jgi:hypothetical protein